METQIEVKIKATSPCAKFYNANPRDQLQKIKEEVLEVEVAYEDFYDANHKDCTLEAREEAAINLVMEMYDVVACVNTLYSQLKCHYPSYFDKKTEVAAELSVVNKNMARGYYAPEV